MGNKTQAHSVNAILISRELRRPFGKRLRVRGARWATAHHSAKARFVMKMSATASTFARSLAPRGTRKRAECGQHNGIVIAPTAQSLRHVRLPFPAPCLGGTRYTRILREARGSQCTLYRGVAWEITVSSCCRARRERCDARRGSPSPPTREQEQVAEWGARSHGHVVVFVVFCAVRGSPGRREACGSE